MGLDHFNSVALLVDQQTIFLALEDLQVLVVLPHLIILLHLDVQLLLVSEIGLSTVCHLLSLLGFKLLLCGNDLKELITIPLSCFLDSPIVVSELFLP